jgi:hypothetical protein
MNHKLFPLVSLVGLLCIAGRPVFHNLTLPELIDRSHVIVIAKKLPPVKASNRSTLDNCAAAISSFRVEKILHRYHNSVQGHQESSLKKSIDSVQLKSKIDVVTNGTFVQDCLNRKINKSGASFPADTYLPSKPNALSQNKSVVLFLAIKLDPEQKIKSGHLKMSADNAFESIDRQPEIQQEIDRYLQSHPFL